LERPPSSAGSLRSGATSIPERTAEEIRELAAGSHLLEAKVRRAILEQVLSQGPEVGRAREILDRAEAFAWVTNPAQSHG
jgi:hypothetical protein